MRFDKKKFILVLFLLSLVLILVITSIPNSRLTSEIKINRGESSPYLLTLDIPEEIWNGQNAKILLQFKKDSTLSELNKYDQNKTGIEAKEAQSLEVDIVLTGVTLDPPGNSFTPILEEKEIIMNWNIKPLIVQDIQGSIWVFINTIQEAQEEGNQRELIFTREINIKNKMILGLKIGTFQGILITLIILNLLFLSLSSRKSRFYGFNK